MMIKLRNLIGKFVSAVAKTMAVVLIMFQVSMAHAMASMDHNTDHGAAVHHTQHNGAKHMSSANANMTGESQLERASQFENTGLSHDDHMSDPKHDGLGGHCSAICMSALMPVSSPAAEKASPSAHDSGLSSAPTVTKLAGPERPPRT